MAALPSASGASAPRSGDALRRDGAALPVRSGSALHELYSLDSRRAAAQVRLRELRTRTAEVARQRAAVRARLTLARGTLAATQRVLARRLRALYEEGGTHVLEVVLGAASVGEAIESIDGLSFVARQDRAIIERTRAARERLARLAGTLRAHEAELQRLEDSAAAQVAGLERARAAVISTPAAERSRAPTEAAASEARASGRRALTLTATAYAIAGSTATGMPAGRGVVAVDPAVIPLGTRMTIPGYGKGVAADTGPAVQGASIDVWLPSLARARAWGRRTVTVTLHP